MLPMALYCWLAPVLIDAPDGDTVMDVSAGAGAVIVTTEVSALPPPDPMTRKLPDVAPAVYQPLALTVPPVAVHVIAGNVVVPSLHVAAAANCWLAPAASDTDAGVTEMDVSVRTFTVTVAVSANAPLAAMTR
jgi:hypothetical protein